MLEDMQSVIIELSIDDIELSIEEDVGQAIDDDIELSMPEEAVTVSCAMPGSVAAAMLPASSSAAATRSSFFITTSAECGVAR